HITLGGQGKPVGGIVGQRGKAYGGGDVRGANDEFGKFTIGGDGFLASITENIAVKLGCAAGGGGAGDASHAAGTHGEEPREGFPFRVPFLDLPVVQDPGERVTVPPDPEVGPGALRGDQLAGVDPMDTVERPVFGAGCGRVDVGHRAAADIHDAFSVMEVDRL